MIHTHKEWAQKVERARAVVGACRSGCSSTSLQHDSVLEDAYSTFAFDEDFTQQGSLLSSERVYHCLGAI